MTQNTLRIEQYETLLYNANLNPLGIPGSVRRAIQQNIGSIVKYPDAYYNSLKKSVAAYAGVPMDYVVMGNGSVDLIKLYATLVGPKKALILVPGSSEYEFILSSYNTELVFYNLKEEKDFELDVNDLIQNLDESLDMVIIGNPNNPTSKKITREDVKALADACKSMNIFLVIDEMYIEFVDNYKDFTAVPLTEEYSNLAVIRSVSKFFAVPGLRFAYALMNNPEMKEIVDRITTKNNIASLTAIAVTDMFKDEEYITESQSIIHTERSLVYLAMSTSRSIKLYKPEANFMLVKLLKEDLTSADVAEHCNLRGVIIRKCDNIRGLDEKYIRFCFMNPKQNDLMVNTILEIV